MTVYAITDTKKGRTALRLLIFKLPNNTIPAPLAIYCESFTTSAKPFPVGLTLHGYRQTNTYTVDRLKTYVRTSPGRCKQPAKTSKNNNKNN